MEVGSILLRFGVDTSELKTGLRDAEKGMASWRDETNKGSRDMLKWGAAIGASVAPVIAAGYAINALTQKFGEQAEQLKDLSYQTGISTDYLQRLQYAAVLSGDDFGTVSFGINKLTLTMGQFANGSKEAREAFALVGVTPSGKGVDQVFEEIAKAVTDNIDPTQRAAAAVALFGKNGKEMLPFMEDYVRNLEKIKSLSTLTQEELEANIQAKIIIDDTGKKWENTEAKMLSYFTSLFGKWDESLDKIRSMEGKTGNNLSAIDRFIFGMSDPVGSGAERSPWVNPTSLQAADKIIDKYTGLSEAGFKYQLAIDEINDAQSEMDAAMENEDQKAFDAASKRHQQAIIDFQKLREEMGKVSDTAKSTAAIWDPNSVVGAAGSNMQLFMAREMAAGTSYQDALNNWGYGTPTNTSVKQDTLGALSGSGTKAILPGTPELTSQVQTETSKQADAYTTLNDSIKTGWIDLEAKGLIHYTAMSELFRIHDQAALDNMAALVNFAGENPIVQNKIIMSKDGPDWTPAEFTAISAPTLKMADFSKVQFSGKSGQLSGDIKSNIKVDVVVKDQTSGGIKVDVQSVTEKMASASGAGGGK